MSNTFGYLGKNFLLSFYLYLTQAWYINIVMSTTILSQPELIIKVSNYITKKRNDLLGDLVCYDGDTVRYKRRIRFLCQLAELESQLIKKISNFETDNPEDFNNTLAFILIEIDSVTSIDS